MSDRPWWRTPPKHEVRPNFVRMMVPARVTLPDGTWFVIPAGTEIDWNNNDQDS